MRVDVRPVARMRSEKPVDVPAALAPVFTELAASSLDLDRLRVVCDWIQYRANFRPPVDHRPVLVDGVPAGEGPWPQTVAGRTAGVELAVDLRRCPDVDVATALKETLAEYADPSRTGAVALEPWVPARQGSLWRFNALYWQALAAWEEASGHGYEKALPGGVSDARDVEAAAATIRDLFAAWDDLDGRGELPDELYVLEIGVGNGGQARTWLDTFAELDAEHGRGYYPRLRYLMGDYSPQVLDRAREAVAGHADRVSTLALDATKPRETIGFLAGRVFLIYLSNLYDNLPSDEVAAIDGRPYLVQTRAYIPEPDARAISATYDVPAGGLADLVDRLLRLGPELLAEVAPRHFTGTTAAVEFWREVWSAVRRAERYVPLEDTYEIAPGVDAAPLRDLLAGLGEVRMHVSNGAAGAFADALPLLHRRGSLVCHDLFVTDAAAYRTGFYGPGKYDGSVVNWVNGPLLRRIAEPYGVDVEIGPFAPRPEANVKTLTARPRA